MRNKLYYFRGRRTSRCRARYYGVYDICISPCAQSVAAHYFLNECQMLCYITVFPLQTVETVGLGDEVQ